MCSQLLAHSDASGRPALRSQLCALGVVVLNISGGTRDCCLLCFVLLFVFCPAGLLPSLADHQAAQHPLCLLSLTRMFLVLAATTELRDFFAKARNGSVRLIKVVIEDGKSWV